MLRLLFFFLVFFGSGKLLSQTFIPGASYLDSNGYVEYIAGNLPIVFSAPHGGYLEPSSIPDRNCTGCVYGRDSYTQDLAYEIMKSFSIKTGCFPHMVINLLHRKKFDANRDIGDAADGNSTVEKSWYAYHNFIDSAKGRIVKDYSRGIFFDLHGHGHSIQRIELGYALTKSELQLSDSLLNTAFYIGESTIQKLALDNLHNISHAELLRGNSSFGSVLQLKGYPAVPSSSIPFPLSNEPYFTGGYNTRRHGSLDSGAIDGIQIECNQSIRFDSLARKVYADSLVSSIIELYSFHYDSAFIGNYCNLISKIDPVQSRYEVVIYPNPASNSLNISSDYQDLDLKIYDSKGMNKTLFWDGQIIDISEFIPGLYSIVIMHQGRLVGHRKIIKK